MITAVLSVGRGNETVAFKKVTMHRPVAGDHVADGDDLAWKVERVRLILGKPQIGVDLEPANDAARDALSDPSFTALKSADWQVFHPRAHSN